MSTSTRMTRKRRSPSPNIMPKQPTGRGTSPSRIPVPKKQAMSITATEILKSCSKTSKTDGIKKLEWVKQTQPKKQGEGSSTPFMKNMWTSPSVQTPVKPKVIQPPAKVNRKPWVDVYRPSSAASHFVHPKKIEEVEQWFTSGCQGKILLLAGPSGSGKTATVFVVARRYGFKILEWINPVDIIDFPTESHFDIRDEIDNFDLVKRFGRKSQVEQFSEYLMRSSHYDSLPMKITNSTPENQIQKAAADKGTKPLILVEDLPNIFYKKTDLFHELLRNYQTEGGCPLIFILADSSSAEFGAYRLFPPSLLTQLRIRQISFNPVAVSFMTKFLCTICATEKISMGKSELEELAIASGGDMRWAINNLEFKAQGQSTSSIFKKPPSGPKTTIKERKRAAAKNTTHEDSVKDETVFLFHAVGKVLYAKRDVTMENPIEAELLGTDLAEHCRPHSLIENPEHIAEKVQVAPQTFFNFLSHNYLSFYKNLDDAVRASELLADAADILSHWSTEESVGKLQKEFGLSIAIRGLMHSNTQRVASSFKPLQKPQSTEALKKAEQNILMTRDAFPHLILRDFYAEELPFYSKLSVQKFNVNQKEVIKKVAMIREGSVRKNFLVEKEAIDDDDDDDDDEDIPKAAVATVRENQLESLETVVNSNDCDDEDDYVIEDYDDE